MQCEVTFNFSGLNLDSSGLIGSFFFSKRKASILLELKNLQLKLHVVNFLHKRLKYDNWDFQSDSI